MNHGNASLHLASQTNESNMLMAWRNKGKRKNVKCWICSVFWVLLWWGEIKSKTKSTTTRTKAFPNRKKEKISQVRKEQTKGNVFFFRWKYWEKNVKVFLLLSPIILLVSLVCCCCGSLAACFANVHFLEERHRQQITWLTKRNLLWNRKWLT